MNCRYDRSYISQQVSAPALSNKKKSSIQNCYKHSYSMELRKQCLQCIGTRKDEINFNFVQNQLLDGDCSILNIHVYICVGVLCVYTYIQTLSSRFILGRVKLVTLRVNGKMHGIRNCSPVLWDSCPQSWPFPCYDCYCTRIQHQSQNRAIPKIPATIMTHLVCHHSLESRGTTSNHGGTQSPVPLKFIIELS